MTSLADMTPAQRAQCVGMWCDYDASDDENPNLYGSGIIYRDVSDGGELIFAVKDPQLFGEVFTPAVYITPRPDLPRAWTPQGGPVSGEWVHEQDEPGTYAPRNGARAYRRFVTDWEPT
ncbi:Hypothetical protein Cul210931_1871 [Corynebacterium ulcerans]|uniref:hypothetical protein n=1 Tax=Corynebacterium ulcerans TaxID=65058 RepID=UPI00052114EE|nr:hypothetical protein [Corynebacterium ulcerans]AIU31186.1 Hypothetical protein Cul210931_1871 [Corynebacterium ulcerans]